MSLLWKSILFKIHLKNVVSDLVDCHGVQCLQLGCIHVPLLTKWSPTSAIVWMLCVNTKTVLQKPRFLGFVFIIEIRHVNF